MPSINVNGRIYEIEIDPQTPLLWYLRDHLGLMGTKYSCGIAECGSGAREGDLDPGRRYAQWFQPAGGPRPARGGAGCGRAAHRLEASHRRAGPYGPSAAAFGSHQLAVRNPLGSSKYSRRISQSDFAARRPRQKSD